MLDRSSSHDALEILKRDPASEFSGPNPNRRRPSELDKFGISVQRQIVQTQYPRARLAKAANTAASDSHVSLAYTVVFQNQGARHLLMIGGASC